MALPQIVQTLLELAEQVESNNISGSDARGRVEQVTESLAAYSAVTDLHINEVMGSTLRTDHENKKAKMCNLEEENANGIIDY